MKWNTYSCLDISSEQEIAVLTLNRPRALNALNSQLLGELDEVTSLIERSKEIRALIVTGSGPKAFAAGADISEMVHASPAEGRAMALLSGRAFRRLETMPQVTIAAVNGYALGGGCELSMACDIRIAAENAVFGQPETGLGILPGFGGTQRLSRLIGKGRAKELIFCGGSVSAQEAWRMGLANRVVPAESLMDTCLELARVILSKGSYAVALAKKAIESGMDTDLENGLLQEADLFGLSFSTRDKEEGMTAFLEKRPANLRDF